MNQLNPYHKRRRFPYFKAQLYTWLPKYNRSAWVDVQKAYRTAAEATERGRQERILTGREFRVMEITERGRAPLASA